MNEAARWQPASPGERISFIDGLAGDGLVRRLDGQPLVRLPRAAAGAYPAAGGAGSLGGPLGGMADRGFFWNSRRSPSSRSCSGWVSRFKRNGAGARGVSARWFLVRPDGVAGRAGLHASAVHLERGHSGVVWGFAESC